MKYCLSQYPKDKFIQTINKTHFRRRFWSRSYEKSGEVIPKYKKIHMIDSDGKCYDIIQATNYMMTMDCLFQQSTEETENDINSRLYNLNGSI